MRNPKDFYPTPRAAFESLIPELGPLKHLMFWEPACGDRRLIRILKEKGFTAKGNDLHFGYDFLADDRRHQVILTNPPFSKAAEFVLHALQVSDTVIMLLPLGFLASQRRAAMFKADPLHSLYVLSKRPSFTFDGKTDAMDYAWFVWTNRTYMPVGIFHLT